MFGKRKNNKPSYGIIGLGRFGFALAKELASSGAEVLAIDQDEERVREIREVTENALVVHITDKKSLEETGIQNCNVAVICVGEHIDVSILMTLHLVGLGIPTVIAKATSAEHGEILEKLGAQVVYPEKDMAIRLAHRLESAGTLDFVQLSEQVNVSKQVVPAQMIGKTVVEANLRGRFSLNIVAIENGSDVTPNIRPDYVFRPGDILFVVGERKGIQALTEWKE